MLYLTPMHPGVAGKLCWPHVQALQPVHAQASGHNTSTTTSTPSRFKQSSMCSSPSFPTYRESQSNNITTIAHLNHIGGKSMAMNLVMHQILNLCTKEDIQLSAIFLPGASNTQVDYLSCLHPHHEWHLAPAIFNQINKHWGPHSVDQTVTATNKQLPRFNSHFTEPGCKVVDCLLQDWRQENNWCTPPIALILCILKLMIHQQATTMIMVPCWPGCHWFSA